MQGESGPFTVAAKDIPVFLHQPIQRENLNERIDRPGIATGLAWTPVGGDILFVEAAMMSAEKEDIILTGMLGEVMRESATAALTYLRSNAAYFGIDENVFHGKSVHIHVPRGAIPKDGPSAGVTILAALVSLLKRHILPTDMAMTGEITLRGKILPVGGIREKVLAAYRYGIRKLIIPLQNENDLDDISSSVRDHITFIPVDSAEELIAVLFSDQAEHVAAS
jgi:ATP-dependent Lon protease